MMRNRWVFGLVILAFSTAGGCVVSDPGGNDNGNDNTSGNDNEDPAAVEVRVEPGFGSATRQKTTTGVEEAGICGGWYPTTANHMLYVDAALSMTLRVTSDDGAPQLWILCDQSNFCGTQVDDNTTEFSRFWTTGGPCEIYIGTTESDAELTYTLTLTEDE